VRAQRLDRARNQRVRVSFTREIGRQRDRPPAGLLDLAHQRGRIRCGMMVVHRHGPAMAGEVARDGAADALGGAVTRAPWVPSVLPWREDAQPPPDGKSPGKRSGRAEETRRPGVPQPRIVAAEPQQRLVAALLDDAAALEIEDAVHAGDGREPVAMAITVRPPSARTALPGCGARSRCPVSSWLVEHEDAGILQDGPRDGEALALAARELDACSPTMVS